MIMHYMKVDIVDLLKQVGLENDNKIKEANLEFRWKLPEHKVILNLDSQKTYRVFENLIVNITKYAMPHTRAYIEMEESDSQVRIFMKNVSATELNFNVEEITEQICKGRFFTKYRRLRTRACDRKELHTAAARRAEDRDRGGSF